MESSTTAGAGVYICSYLTSGRRKPMICLVPADGSESEPALFCIRENQVSGFR